jgi:hypothetical protein
MALALRIMVHPTEMDSEHSLQVRLIGEDGQEVAQVQGTFGVNDPTILEPGEEAGVSIPLAMHELMLPMAGTYSFEILIDGTHHASVPFRAHEAGGSP